MRFISRLTHRQVERVARSRPSPKWVFVISMFGALAIGVPAAFAVGWVGYFTNADLGSQSASGTGPIYSSQQRMYQNQTQLDSSDPQLDLTYSYDGSNNNLFADACCIGYGVANPYVWNQSGGNKYAWCANYTNYDGDRLITCQYYSTT